MRILRIALLAGAGVLGASGATFAAGIIVPVPEPSSLAALVTGIGVLAAVKFFRRK